MPVEVTTVAGPVATVEGGQSFEVQIGVSPITAEVAAAGVPGPQGPPGDASALDDMADLTLIFNNSLL